MALLRRVADDSREPRGIPAPPAGPDAPTRKGPFRVRDTVLAVAFILLVIALSTGLVLLFLALVGWLVRSCIG